MGWVISPQQPVRQWVQNEPAAIRIWARIHLGKERRVGVAKDFGYRDGSGVTHLLKGLDRRATGAGERKPLVCRWRQI